MLILNLIKKQQQTLDGKSEDHVLNRDIPGSHFLPQNNELAVIPQPQAISGSTDVSVNILVSSGKGKHI